MLEGHGDFQVENDAEIITFVAKGVWNEESSKACIAAITKHVDRLSSEKFAIVVDTRDVEGLTADSVALWFEAIQYWATKGHSAIARVDDPASITYKVFLKSFDEYFQEKILFTYTESVETGIHWANENGFTGSFSN